METVRHKIMDGRVQVYKRPDGPNWWCSCTIDGKQRRATTGEESLARAKDVARDWYLTLLGKLVANDLGASATVAADAGGLGNVSKFLSGDFADVGKGKKRPDGMLFAEAADRFINEFEAITEGERNSRYILNHRNRLKNHLVPYFGQMGVNDITSGLAQKYRMHRLTSYKAEVERVAAETAAAEALKAERLAAGLPEPPPQKKGRNFNLTPPAKSTLHQEFVVLHQVLAYAYRNQWLRNMPDLKPPYKSSGKITHRAWFSKEEYKALYEATADRAENPRKEQWRKHGENLHDLVLIMGNTGLRPDEALRLEYRDVDVVKDDATGQRILVIKVHKGKRGVGICKSMPGAVYPFQRLKKRSNGQLTDRLFPTFSRELFNTILDELKLKKDRDGRPRTLYSLRHTYICLRLMDGADIYAIAKNCRTSVEMIQKHYAAHIQNSIDASAINVRKSKSAKDTAH